MERSPRLLFLTYYFPPVEAVASVRTGNIAKHLARLGWDVTVVCPDPSLFRNVGNIDDAAREWQQCGVRRILTRHHCKFLSPGTLKAPGSFVLRFAGKIGRCTLRALKADPVVGWYSVACRACDSIHPDDVDVILASGPPWITFEAAHYLSRKLHRPLALDYRDLWSTGYPCSDLFSAPRQKRREAKALSGCRAVSIIAPSMAAALRQFFSVDAETAVIPNGYDPSEYSAVTPATFGHFAIVYAGGFYPPHRTIEPVMRAVRLMKQAETHRPWMFHYYGPRSEHVRESAREFAVEDKVVIHGRVPRHECLAAIKGAGAAVVICSVYPTFTLGQQSIVTGKLFEAIGLGTPFLVVAPAGTDVESVVDTVGNGRILPGHDTAAMVQFLTLLMCGAAPKAGKPERYSWPQIIPSLDRLLRSAMNLRDDSSDLPTHPF